MTLRQNGIRIDCADTLESRFGSACRLVRQIIYVVLSFVDSQICGCVFAVYIVTDFRIELMEFC